MGCPGLDPDQVGCPGLDPDQVGCPGLDPDQVGCPGLDPDQRDVLVSEMSILLTVVIFILLSHFLKHCVFRHTFLALHS